MVRIVVGIGVTAIVPIVLASQVTGCRAQDDFVPHKDEFLEVAQRLEESQGRSHFLSNWQVDELQQQLAAGGLRNRQLLELHQELSEHLLRLGDAAGAVEHIEVARNLAPVADASQNELESLHLSRAITFLRQAEIANCIRSHNAQCCIFPLEGGGIHTRRDPTRQAKEIYLQYLEMRPENLGARWLLNIVSMALNEYPHGVPDRFLIPPEAFASDYEVGRFADIAAKLGVDTFNLCGGVIVDDFDGDHLLDIVTSTFDPRGPLTYYRNRTGSFQDASASSHAEDQLGGLNCVAADYDNDGDMDVLILRGAWLNEDGCIRT